MGIAGSAANRPWKARRRRSFRQFHLCQWTNNTMRWMPMDKWMPVRVVDTRMLEGRPCYARLDLSARPT